MSDITSAETESVSQLPEYTLTPAMYGTGVDRKLIALSDTVDTSHESVLNAHSISIDFSLGTDTVAIGRDNETKSGLTQKAPEDAYLVDISDLGKDNAVSRFHGYFKHHTGNYRGIAKDATNVLLYSDKSASGTVFMEPTILSEQGKIEYNTKFLASQALTPHYTFQIMNGTILEFPKGPDNEEQISPRILCLQDPLNPTKWTLVRVGDIKDIDKSLYNKFLNIPDAEVTDAEDPLTPHERRQYNYYSRMPSHWDENGIHNQHAVDFQRMEQTLNTLQSKIQNKK